MRLGGTCADVGEEAEGQEASGHKHIVRGPDTKSVGNTARKDAFLLVRLEPPGATWLVRQARSAGAATPGRGGPPALVSFTETEGSADGQVASPLRSPEEASRDSTTFRSSASWRPAGGAEEGAGEAAHEQRWAGGYL